MMMCINCGKWVSDKILICDACGTDYRENKEPQCDHVYDKFEAELNSMDFVYNLWLKCEKCGETIELRCTEGLIHQIIGGPSSYTRMPRLGVGRYGK